MDAYDAAHFVRLRILIAAGRAGAREEHEQYTEQQLRGYFYRLQLRYAKAGAAAGSGPRRDGR